MLCVVDTVFSGRLLCRRNVHNAMANVHVEGVAVFYKQGFGSTGGEGEAKASGRGWGVRTRRDPVTSDKSENDK